MTKYIELFDGSIENLEEMVKRKFVAMKKDGLLWKVEPQGFLPGGQILRHPMSMDQARNELRKTAIEHGAAAIVECRYIKDMQSYTPSWSKVSRSCAAIITTGYLVRRY